MKPMFRQDYKSPPCHTNFLRRAVLCKDARHVTRGRTTSIPQAGSSPEAHVSACDLPGTCLQGLHHAARTAQCLSEPSALRGISPTDRLVQAAAAETSTLTRGQLCVPDSCLMAPRPRTGPQKHRSSNQSARRRRIVFPPGALSSSPSSPR
jgi:hypothetical protein